LFVGLGILMSGDSFFSPMREALRTKSIPVEMLNYGQFGKILKQLLLIKHAPNDDSRFPPTKNDGEDIEGLTFQKKRKVGDDLFSVNPYGMQGFKSTSVMAGVKNKQGWPIFSIVTSEENLFDSETGILANRDKKGQEWERPADFTYIEDGEVRFTTSVGLRLHGGKRRTTKPYNSYRIYFREQYGIKAFPADILYPENPDLTPLRTIVLHTTDWPPGYPLNNPLAYDIAREIGSIVPRTRLIEIYLNGDSLGMGIAIEHMSRKQWKQRWGHDEFHFHRFRSEIKWEDTVMYHNRFWKPVTDHESFSMQRVASSINLDNFSRHIFSWVFCADEDYWQGVAVLDKKDADAKLFWINWDMDHSFYDNPAVKNPQLKRENWQQPAFKMVYMKHHIDGRTKLFTRLMNESDEYKIYFINLATELLNHTLTEDFLFSRVHYYKKLLEQYGEPHKEYIAILKRFMEKRPDFVRQDMKNLFNLEGPYRLIFRSSVKYSVFIDGYQESSNYHGKYFAGQTCSIRLPDDQQESFSHWLVNGERVMTNILNLVIAENTEVKAVFN